MKYSGLVVGLTGGIAMGKSTVSKTFIENGIPVVDADQVARDVVIPGSIGLNKIIKHFGEDFLNKDGSLNRAALGQLVFFSDKEMNYLNGIMEPLITSESNRQINSFFNKGHKIVVYDAALIVEKGNVEKFRPLIVVSCPQDIQVQRLMSRNSLTRDEAMARINSQGSIAAKVAVADYVIDTSLSIENSVNQTIQIINHLRNKVSDEPKDNS
jgi:dephospho-CoA kinase